MIDSELEFGLSKETINTIRDILSNVSAVEKAVIFG